MSLKEALEEHVGKEGFKQIMDSAGSRCLIILEGLDELAAERRQNDLFLCSLLKQHPLLKEAIIIITSRPHACKKLTVNRKIEVIGFSMEQIREYVEKSFSSDPQLVKKFLQQLDEYPHLLSVCYVPICLAMIVDIFSSSKLKMLPISLTELYQQFIVMLLQRELSKDNASQQLSLVAVSGFFEKSLCELFEGIPKQSINLVFSLSKLAYIGIFGKETNASKTKKQKDPKIIFTTEDLIQCGIKVTGHFDGLGLLKYTFTPEMATGTYNFTHLTLQELMCAFYMSNLPIQEQLKLMDKYFDEYPSIFTFLCGITRLSSSEMLQFVISKLKIHNITALKCIYESRLKHFLQPMVLPMALDFSYSTLLHYDCLCISNILSFFPISTLNIMGCYVGNKGAEVLVKYCSNQSSTVSVLKELYLYGNNLTANDGVIHMMKIVKLSKLSIYILMYIFT